MGLDINAYKGLHPVDPADIELDSDGYPRDYEHYVRLKDLALMHEDIWPGRSAPYADADADYYEFDDEDYMRAGSYSSYHHWKCVLEDFADREQLPEDTFVELIEFSDCEGLIGSVVSDKLYGDFTEYRDRLDDFVDGYFADEMRADWFVEKYDEWIRMFAMGRDDGAVFFG